VVGNRGITAGMSAISSVIVTECSVKYVHNFKIFCSRRANNYHRRRQQQFYFRQQLIENHTNRRRYLINVQRRLRQNHDITEFTEAVNLGIWNEF